MNAIFLCWLKTLPMTTPGSVTIIEGGGRRTKYDCPDFCSLFFQRMKTNLENSIAIEFSWAMIFKILNHFVKFAVFLRFFYSSNFTFHTLTSFLIFFKLVSSVNMSPCLPSRWIRLSYQSEFSITRVVKFSSADPTTSEVDWAVSGVDWAVSEVDWAVSEEECPLSRVGKSGIPTIPFFSTGEVIRVDSNVFSFGTSQP